MFRKIAVAYDESPYSERALTTAISLAATLGSTLHIITVVESQPGYVNISLAIDPTLPSRLQNERRERLKQIQTLAVRHAADAGVSADCILVDGPEVDTILTEVNAWNADLLVVGLSQQGHGGVGEFISTVHLIGMKIPCPVLAVP
jgi:nucleotide-binding universal stress UspA family protein